MEASYQGRSSGLQTECSIGLVIVGCLVISLGITSAALLPICYMLYASQTALGLLYLITGILSYVVTPRTHNYAAKSGVTMTLHVFSWVWTAYIFQVAMNLMSQSFHQDRTITPAECGYSSDSADEIMYYSFGAVSLLFAVAYIVLSGFVFAAFWRNGRLSPQMPMGYTIAQPTYQLQPVAGQTNAAFIPGPSGIQQTQVQSQTYGHEAPAGLPTYTQTQPNQAPTYSNAEPKDN